MVQTYMVEHKCVFICGENSGTHCHTAQRLVIHQYKLGYLGMCSANAAADTQPPLATYADNENSEHALAETDKAMSQCVYTQHMHQYMYVYGIGIGGRRKCRAWCRACMCTNGSMYIVSNTRTPFRSSRRIIPKREPAAARVRYQSNC